jgi:hypothetical protein
MYFETSDGYKTIYDGMDYVKPYVFSTGQWYYVAVWLRCGLAGSADFYRYPQQVGCALWHTTSISWHFYAA